ncbi:hypothetical protein M0802_005963 [Mischocyttarus mexicanus]|nr:hypothetical protein M0802_005963 [Mischocyttarus mexicanus]
MPFEREKKKEDEIWREDRTGRGGNEIGAVLLSVSASTPTLTPIPAPALAPTPTPTPTQTETLSPVERQAG